MRDIAGDEPLYIVRIARWFTTAPASLTYISYMAKGVPERPHCLAPFVALYLSQAFNGEHLLSDIFTFQGKPQDWARQAAQVVTVQRKVQKGRKGVRYTSTVVNGADIWQRPAPVVTRAKSVHHTLAWFRHLAQQNSSAFCIPFSANTDLIFVLKLADGTHIWVALQTLVNTAATGVSKDELEDAFDGLLPKNMLYDTVSQDITTRHSTHPLPYRSMTVTPTILGPISSPKIWSCFPHLALTLVPTHYYAW